MPKKEFSSDPLEAHENQRVRAWIDAQDFRRRMWSTGWDLAKATGDKLKVVINLGPLIALFLYADGWVRLKEVLGW